MDTDQGEENKTFADEGWPNVTYDYKVEQVELPSFDTLQAMAKGQAQMKGSAYAAAAQAGSRSGSGSAAHLRFAARCGPASIRELLGSAAAAAGLAPTRSPTSRTARSAAC